LNGLSYEKLKQVIEVFTDGSCTGDSTGAWVAMVLLLGEKAILRDLVPNTTHNRMELLAVIKAIEFTDEKCKDASFMIYTDSQYVHHIPERKEKLKKNQFLTKKGTPIQNEDLVKILIDQIDSHDINFVKIKAHQNSKLYSAGSPEAYNCEVDRLARKLVRGCYIEGHGSYTVYHRG
jgi:ribonuclease HI